MVGSICFTIVSFDAKCIVNVISRAEVASPMGTFDICQLYYK